MLTFFLVNSLYIKFYIVIKFLLDSYNTYMYLDLTINRKSYQNFALVGLLGISVFLRIFTVAFDRLI